LQGEVEQGIKAVQVICRGRHSKAIRPHLTYLITNQSRMAYAKLMALKLPIGSGAIERYRAPRRQLALERTRHFLVSCQCRGYIALALVRSGGAVEPLATYGHFTPSFARSLTGKMGTRPSTFDMSSGQVAYLGDADKVSRRSISSRL
jgi:hypothetical protein